MKRSLLLTVLLVLLSLQPLLAGTGSTPDDIFIYMVLIGLMAVVIMISWMINKLVEMLSGNREKLASVETELTRSHTEPQADEGNDEVSDKALSPGIVFRYALSKEQA